MLGRRRLLLLVGIGCVALPQCGLAQSVQRIRRIGVLDPAPRDTFAERRDRFLKGMQKAGYIEGRHFVIEARVAEGDYARLPAMARELVALPVDVLVTQSSPGLRAAQAASSTLPIVSISTGDAVASGFARSLARPGGNITGFTSNHTDLDAKLIELVRRVAPRATRVGLLQNPQSSSHQVHQRNVEAGARAMGMVVIVALASTPAEIDRAFASFTVAKVDAVIVASDTFLTIQSPRIAGLALRGRVPTLTQSLRAVPNGLLLAYGRDSGEGWEGAARFVDRIFKGEKPAEIPMEQATEFQLAINLKTAKALGVTIPAELLVAAQRVVE